MNGEKRFFHASAKPTQSGNNPLFRSIDMKIDYIRKTFWDAVRPFHRPLTKAVRRRLGRNYFEHPEMELPPAYEAIQLEVERRLHCYLHVSPDAIKQVLIIGANNGEEIWRIRHTYPYSRFLCFEPSPKWFKKLTENFGEADYVESRELALSESVGIAIFHELPLAGNGSLLSPDVTRWSESNKCDEKEVTSFRVHVSTLDKEAEKLDKIDLLWIDVQGNEGNVLKGGTETLRRVAAIFLEVALVDSPDPGHHPLPGDQRDAA